MKKLNWVIVGTGTIANEFANQFPSESANLYGVSSRTLEKATHFAEKHSIEKIFLSSDELFQDEHVDVIYIAVPHNKHYEWMVESLNAKKHVVCEKTITLSKEQLDRAVELANENGVQLFEAMTIHYMPLYKEIKKWIKENNLGPLKMVQVNFGSYKPLDPSYYFFNKELAGGALFDIGVYALNFVRWFLTSQATEVYTIGNIHETGVDESSAIILRNSEKELATVSLTFRSKMPKQGVVAFENGYFTISNYPRADKATFTDVNGNVTELSHGATETALANEVIEISQIISNNLENPYLPYTLDVLEIMDLVRKEWGLHYSFEQA